MNRHNIASRVMVDGAAVNGQPSDDLHDVAHDARADGKALGILPETLAYFAFGVWRPIEYGTLVAYRAAGFRCEWVQVVGGVEQ